MLAAAAAAPDARAQAAIPLGPDPAGSDAVLSADSPLGPIAYFPARGVRVGHTGLRVGGFSTLEIDREEGESGELALDSINFLVLYQPLDRLRFFAELEVGGLLEVDLENGDARSSVDASFERLYAEWSQSDALNLRIGKFQTPVGRWNLVAAEPFVWTASEPVQIERAFDEHQTGVALHGTLYPGRRQLRYWVYGQMVDPLDADPDFESADRSAGARLELGDELTGWSVGTSLLASRRDGAWSYLGGLDAEWRRGPLQLTAELVLGDGDIPGRSLWSVYLQGVYDLGALHAALDGLYAVGRYERFDARDEDGAHIVDVGLTWIPKPYLNLKVGYRFADRETDDVRRGLSASLSVLF